MQLTKALESHGLVIKHSPKAGTNGANIIIGNSPVMLNLFQKIEVFSNLDVPICIQGQSGTGKEMVAKALHFNGKRGDNSFSAVNCSGIPRDLLESTLFGYMKGAFTGATRDRIGEFQSANGGTLFLDEISEMPLELQAKLLRALQEKRIKRVGDTKELNIDVRIITATSKNLEEEVKAKRFREDLYYRINVIPLQLPKLSERLDDIPTLADEFIDKYNGLFESSGIKIGGISEGAIAKLKGKDEWPGNVRQLENVIQRSIVITGRGTIEAESILFSDSEFQNAKIAPQISSPNNVIVLENPNSQSSRSRSPSKGGIAFHELTKWYQEEGGITAVTTGELTKGGKKQKEILGDLLRQNLIYSLPSIPIRNGQDRGRIVFLTPLSLETLFEASRGWAITQNSLREKINDRDGFNSVVNEPFMITMPDALSKLEFTYSNSVIKRKALGTTFYISVYPSYIFVLDKQRAPDFINLNPGTEEYDSGIEVLDDLIHRYYKSFSKKTTLELVLPKWK